MRLIAPQGRVPGPGANPYHAGLRRIGDPAFVVERVHIGRIENMKQALDRTDGKWKNQRIRLSRMPIPKSECETLHKTLATMTSVVGLELLDCEIDRADLLVILKHIRDYHLQTMQLSKLMIEDEAAALLSVALEETSIKSLDLSWNEITKKGADRLASALKNCALEHLSLAQNNIGTTGAQKICEVIANKHTMLRSLDLSRNEIIDHGAFAVAEAIPDTMLEVVTVKYNRMTPRGIEAICQAVGKSKIMRELSLAGNVLGNGKCADAICEMLKTSKTLEALDLGHSNLTDNELPTLAEGVMACPSLRFLRLSMNAYIKDSAVQAFMHAIRSHQTLEEVEMDDCARVSQNTVKLSKRIVRRMTSQATKTLVLLSVAWTSDVYTEGKPWQRWDKGLIRRLAEALGEDPLKQAPLGPPVYQLIPVAAAPVPVPHVAPAEEEEEEDEEE